MSTTESADDAGKSGFVAGGEPSRLVGTADPSRLVGTADPSRLVGTADRRPPADLWIAAHSSAEFAALRTRLRRFVFPMTAFFLAWYLAYVLLAAFASNVMAIKVVGNVNVGLVFGLLQFVSTFVITMMYVRFANRNLDPVSSRIREQIEGELR